MVTFFVMGLAFAVSLGCLVSSCPVIGAAVCCGVVCVCSTGGCDLALAVPPVEDVDVEVSFGSVLTGAGVAAVLATAAAFFTTNVGSVDCSRFPCSWSACCLGCAGSVVVVSVLGSFPVRVSVCSVRCLSSQVDVS